MLTWEPDHRRSKVLERKHAAILDAAREEFQANGFGGATMLAIAGRAGVSTATLYRHAKTKEELFAAVVALRTSPEEARLAVEHLASLPLLQMLEALAAGSLQALSRPDITAMRRVVASEAARFPMLGRIVFDTYHLHFRTTLVDLLARRGYAIDAPTADAFFTQALGDSELRLLFGLEIDPEVQAARALRAAQDLAAQLDRHP